MRNRSLMIVFAAGLAACSLLAWAQDEMPRTAAPDSASVYFIGLSDGDTVSSPLTIRFGLSGMGIAPAGIEHDNTGHHHLLVDVSEQDMPAMDRPLPTTDHVLHFGGGQTEATIELDAGEHSLQLLLGDYLHIPHDPPIKSERITITVE